MGDAGWWLILGIEALVEPTFVVLGMGVGLLVGRWREVALGAVLVPLGDLCIHFVRNPTEPFASHLELLPLVAIVGLIWSSLGFALKKSFQDGEVRD